MFLGTYIIYIYIYTQAWTSPQLRSVGLVVVFDNYHLLPGGTRKEIVGVNGLPYSGNLSIN